MTQKEKLIKASKRYYYIKKLLNDKWDNKECVEGFYFNQKAINFVNKIYRTFFANSYYDIQPWQVLANIDEFDTLTDYKKDLYEQYKSYYASAWFENMVEILSNN